jgi:DNA-binding response OmpR family regulator
LSTHILIVDDDPGIRQVLTRFLGARGYEVETAADGGEALEAIRRRQPDVLLLDIYLPTMSGIDVLYELQREGRVIPTITFSGRPDDQMARESSLLGAEGFIYKPFKLEHLESKLQAKLTALGFGPAAAQGREAGESEGSPGDEQE